MFIGHHRRRAARRKRTPGEWRGRSKIRHAPPRAALLDYAPLERFVIHPDRKISDKSVAPISNFAPTGKEGGFLIPAKIELVSSDPRWFVPEIITKN